MRAASTGLGAGDEEGPADPTAFVWADEGSSAPSSSDRSGGGGSKKWWQRRFQALYLPTVVAEDGALGFVQLDVSLNPST